MTIESTESISDSTIILTVFSLVDRRRDEVFELNAARVSLRTRTGRKRKTSERQFAFHTYSR